MHKNAVQTWDHMEMKISLYVHNFDEVLMAANRNAIATFLSSFKNGAEVLDAAGDIINFLMPKLAKGTQQCVI